MTDNPALSPQRQLEDPDAALRSKSLGEFVGRRRRVAWNLCRKEL
jgi:Holliday junction DNA helicase RuvB